MTDLRQVFSDYRPGHPTPVDLRIVLGHDDGTPFTAASSLMRIHGTGVQTLAALAVLAHDGFVDWDLVDVDLCSERFGCTHSYWRGPAHVTQEHVLTALTTLVGIGGNTRLPYAEPITTDD
jgi:hypothetical protein